MTAGRCVCYDNFISKYMKLNRYIKNLEHEVNYLEKKNYRIALTFVSKRSALDAYELILKNIEQMDQCLKKIITFRECLSYTYPLSAHVLTDYFDNSQYIKVIAARLGISERTFYRRLEKTCEKVINKYESKIKIGG